MMTLLRQDYDQCVDHSRYTAKNCQNDTNPKLFANAFGECNPHWWK